MYPEPESWPPPGIQQPATIAPPIADASDPMAQAVASLPAIVPVTPVPDVVKEAQGPVPVEAPPEAPTTAQEPPPAPSGPTVQVEADQLDQAETPAIRYVAPGELQVGDVVGFSDGPLAIADRSSQGNLYVMADCTIRSFSHLQQVPVLPF